MKTHGVPCTDEQWQRWKAAAGKTGKASVAQFIRDACDLAADAAAEDELKK